MKCLLCNIKSARVHFHVTQAQCEVDSPGNQVSSPWASGVRSWRMIRRCAF